MLLPLVMFTLALTGFGALALLVTKADERLTPPAPRPRLRHLALASLFAGLGAALLSFGLGAAGGPVFGSHDAAGLLFLAGYVLGGCGGAALGLRRASKRVRLR